MGKYMAKIKMKWKINFKIKNALKEEIVQIQCKFFQINYIISIKFILNYSKYNLSKKQKKEEEVTERTNSGPKNESDMERLLRQQAYAAYI